MKAAIYARESSDDTKKAPPIEEQINRAKAYLEEQKIEFHKTYQDNGWSGGDWRRPDWNQCVTDAKAHYFQLLIVWNQDRIARDTEQFLWFYRNLKEGGAKVHSLTEGAINMDTAGDRLKHTVIAAAAESFRLNTSDKVKTVYQAKAREAKKKETKLIWGRPERFGKDIRAEARSIRETEPKLGYRKIAKLINEKFGLSLSYMWVRGALRNTPAQSSGEICSKLVP